MYQLPLKFIKCGNNTAICATRIIAIMSSASYPARETMKAERRAGTLINACGPRKARSAIFLDNGSVIASPLSVQRILTSIDKANHIDADRSSNITNTNKIRVGIYDPDEDIDPELLTEADETGVIIPDEFRVSDEDEDDADDSNAQDAEIDADEIDEEREKALDRALLDWLETEMERDSDA